MKNTVKFKKATKIFDANLSGFIEAVSFQESTSDLSLSFNHPINIKAAGIINESGYMGLFQFGEEALYDLGYYLGDRGISYEDIKGKGRETSIYKSWKSQFDSNNWGGKWSGKRGVKSKNDFLNSPKIQYEVIKEWISKLCNQLRNMYMNEFFGRTIQGVEITESGAIAGMHLVGPGGLGAFLGIPKFKGGKQTDGNGVHIKEYIRMFNGFNLEICCPRKINISLIDKSENPLINKEVFIVSKYHGKHVTGETKVKVKSDENGDLPVIVRHPDTEIKIVADGKESNTIIQKAKEIQNATLKDFEISKIPATLGKDSTPQPRPQPTKTPQEVRVEQSSSENDKKTIADEKKDVIFNIQIIEGDTGKPISNMGFFLTYKENIKKHTADGNGVKQNIRAEIGQDIEVTVSGDGSKQKIHHFKVEESLNNQTLKVKLPTHSFQLLVKNDGKVVPNIITTVFYRGRQIIKKTNNSGVINLKMLVGFVYGFGVGRKELAKARVVEVKSSITFNVNSGFIKESKQFDLQKNTTVTPQNNQIQSTTPSQSAPEAKKEVPELSQQNTHTETGGRPLTTVSNQAPVTSDTTRYHIYSDGKIKRENKSATGYAEFIYYDDKGNLHNLGKSSFCLAQRWSSKGVKGVGNVYLIDQRKHKEYKNINIGYKWRIDSDDGRYYLSGAALSAVLGAICSLGYAEYTGSGFSCRDGSPGDSVSHLNGENGDFRYIAINNRHMTELTYTSHKHFDWEKNVAFVNALYKFGYKLFGSHPVEIKNNSLLPHSQSWSGHHNHVHLHNFSPIIQDM